MKKVIKWIGVFLLIFLSFLLVVFLPEYAAQQSDRSYMGKSHYYAQETSEVASADLSLAEKLKLLSQDEQDKTEFLILETGSLSKVQKSDADLLDKLEQELQKLEEQELIPSLSQNLNLSEDFEAARLSAVTAQYNLGKVFYFWDLDFLGGNCTMKVDASTYKIYGIEIQDKCVTAYYTAESKRIEKNPGYDAYEQWVKGYVRYLSEGEVLLSADETTQEEASASEEVLEMELLYGGDGFSCVVVIDKAICSLYYHCNLFWDEFTFYFLAVDMAESYDGNMNVK